MGTLAHGRWWLPPRRPERAAAAAALERVGPRRTQAASASASSPAASASARCSRARSCRTRRCCCSTSRSSGVDPASADAIARVFGELRAEGRTLLVSSHDVESARSFDLVLCLNGRQVAFGPPAATLDRATLEATYGTS